MYLQEKYNHDHTLLSHKLWSFRGKVMKSSGWEFSHRAVIERKYLLCMLPFLTYQFEIIDICFILKKEREKKREILTCPSG